MGGNIFAQLGVGGIIVFLFLREMFSYLKTRGNGRNNKPNPTLVPACPISVTIELWEQKLSGAIGRSISEALAPTFERQTEILKAVIHTQDKMMELLIREDERQSKIIAKAE